MSPLIHLKSELRIRPHTKIPGALVVEVWYNGQYIAQVCGQDGPGVRILTKHPSALEVETGDEGVHVINLHIDPSKEG
jgi:hypothetical protein